MNTTPQPEGWIIVNGNTDALDWDGDLHPTKEDAIQSLTGPYQDYCREGEEVDGKHPWSDGYQILPVYREPLPKPERMASERPGGTNADTREASAVSQSPHTLVLTDNGGGLMTMRIECSATPDAPCRRRPPDWMDRESWTDEEATETGHECWAVEWADADPESIIWSGSPIRIPVDVVYDEGVEVIPVVAQPSAVPTEAEIHAAARALDGFSGVLGDDRIPLGRSRQVRPPPREARPSKRDHRQPNTHPIHQSHGFTVLPSTHSGARMTATHECPVTGEPLQPGETVSRTAVAQLTTLVSDLPTLMATADAALAGLHHGDQQGPAGIPDSRPPLNLSALEDLDPIRDTIDAWAASVAHEYSPGYRYQAGDWRAARQLITHHQDRLRRWPETPQMIDDLTTNIHAIEKLVSPQRRSTLSVGDCPSCGNPMRAKPHDAEATCRNCGTTIDLEALRDEARIRTSWKKLPRHQAREAAGDVLGHPIPENTVKSWIRRGKITEYPQPNGRPPLIAVRDLVDLAMAPKARPANAYARR